MTKVTRNQVLDFIILALRWYLAVYMIDYGWGKMTGEQFGVYDPEILDKPMKEVDKFYIAWHLFSLSKSFDIAVGISQIIGAILIVINRTAIIGALFLLPILGQIFLVDVAFTTNMFGAALPVRLGAMIMAAIAIIVYHKDRVMRVWKVLTNQLTTKYKYKWWAYLLLPIVGFATEFVLAILTWPFRLVINWMIR